MTVNIAGGFFRAAIVAACILLPPLSGIFAEWLYCRCGKVASKDRFSLKQTFSEINRRLKEPVVVPAAYRICVFFQLTFNLIGLCMLALKQNLLPALFFQAFGVLAIIAGEISVNRLSQGKATERMLKDFLVCQPVLLAAAAGYFLATGSFTIAETVQQQRILAAELPLLLVAVLGIAYFAGKDSLTVFLRQPENNVFVSFGGIVAAANILAEIYRKAFLLLLSGLLVGYGPAGAVVWAFVFYASLGWAVPALLRWLRRNRVEVHWIHVFFAVGLNLSWLYIKYF